MLLSNKKWFLAFVQSCTLPLILLMVLIYPTFAQSKVYVLKVDAPISPSTASYIIRGVENAEVASAQAVVIELNTPGGLMESMRKIVEKFLSSSVPVVVYVSPSGARAGSAGVFITLAANVAAMAPGTNIGAAHPVGLRGESDSSVMTDKIVNDASAFVRSIAQKRGRNQDWAEQSVRNSVSITENEALSRGVINLISPSLDSLLLNIDGMKVETAKGTVTLSTRDASIDYLEMNWRDKLLTFISDPNIAYILLMLGIYGIIFELWNPGSIFPGIVGGISIVLAGYSLQMLPVNYAGVALILIAIVLFIMEIKVASYGMLTVGGVVSLLLGSILLIDSPLEFMQISVSLIIAVVITTVLFFTFVIGLGIKAQYRRIASGREILIGESATALEDIKPGTTGQVRLHGETWNARCEDELIKGGKAKIMSINGLTLIVNKIN
jgi:membrane-bound serine protease (ClpP class)